MHNTVFTDRAEEPKGFLSNQSYLCPRPLIKDGAPDDFSDEAKVKKYIVKNLDNGPMFSSDHQPIVAHLTYY